MNTVGPNGDVLWGYPEDQEANIDEFKIYIDDEHKADADPSARSVPISSLVTAAGTYRVEVTAVNATDESPKAGVDFRLITGVPMPVSDVRVE